MADITDYPDLNGLEEDVEEAWQAAQSEFVGMQDNEDRARAFANLNLERAVILGPWGRGDATMQQDMLDIILYVSLDEEDVYLSDDETLSSSQLFRDAQEFLEERIQESITPDEVMREWFSGINVGMIGFSELEDSLNYLLQQDTPERGFDLTTKNILNLTPSGIQRDSIDGGGGAPEPPDQPIEEEAPTDIVQFPYKEELIDRLDNAFEESLAHQVNEEGDTALEGLVVDRHIVVGEWGRGLGRMRDTPLSVITIVSSPTDDNVNARPGFPRQLQNLYRRMVSEFEPFQAFTEWFDGIQISAAAKSLEQRNLEHTLSQQSPFRAYDLTNDNLLQLDDGEIIEAPAEYEEEEEEPEEEEPEEPEPDIPVLIQRFGISDDYAEFPAGKPTKRVEAREPYDFELELATPGDGETSIDEVITEGIGEAVAAQQYGTMQPAATFPRSGIYIKYRLYYEGPTWLNRLYKDLVYYSGLISSVYDASLKPGKYSTFREYVYRLKEVERRDLGPPLIRELSEQEVVEMGLESSPSLPDGTPAPWLEDRSFIDVVEENMDHEAWYDVTGFIYGEEE